MRVKLYDCSGAQPWMVTNQPLFPENAEGRLNAKKHGAKFMDSTLLGQLPSGFKGTLVVESDTDVIVAVLKTKGGLIFSALPLALVR